MRIAIEALGIHNYGGGRTATINLLQEILEIDNNNEYVLFLSRPEPDLIRSNVRQCIVPFKNRFVVRLWAQVLLPWLTNTCDLVHFVKNLGVFWIRAPFIVTVYDLTVLIYPDLFPRVDVWYWRTLEKYTLWQAAKVIAISHQTAKDIQRFYGLPDERIVVIYPACGRHFRPASSEEIARVRKIYRLPNEYVLHVGRIDPKKNIPLLIEAFALFRARTNFPGTLVLVGELYNKKPDLRVYEKVEALGLHDVVQFLGAVPDNDMPAVYSGATVVAFPSIHEGFGLVALEALSCGVPLIVNRAGAVTEVVDDAALVMEESTPECLAEMMERVWRYPNLRTALRIAGLKRAQCFSLKETARRTLNIYETIGKLR